MCSLSAARAMVQKAIDLFPNSALTGTEHSDMFLIKPTSLQEGGSIRMPNYLLQGTYTPEAWDALVKNPQNRFEAVRVYLTVW